MSVPRRPVLVIDDDDVVRDACTAVVEAHGCHAIPARSVREALRRIAERPVSAVLLDLKLPDGTGIDVLRELQRKWPGTPVVMISGCASVSEAVEAMRVGAADFVEKPVGRDALVRILDRILAPVPPPAEGERAEVADGARYGMIGSGEAMRRIYQLIEMAAPTRCRVLVAGESGTGKELIARAIHALSPRREAPFLRLNCAAIPSELIESELFGHVKGAFTGAVADRKGCFQAADTGTLFLDEIGDMSLMTQAKLLRVLQEGEVTPVGSSQSRRVDVRILAATSKNLAEEITRGAFRDDLYHRINVLGIAVPPLRDRREDIAGLAEHFLRLSCVENGATPKRLAPRAVEYLEQLPWPGNVRELRNLMERTAVLVSSEVIGHRDVMDVLQVAPGSLGETGSVPLRQARARFERDYILDRLAANRGNLTHTARELGLERTTLYLKMKQLGIPPVRGRA